MCQFNAQFLLDENRKANNYSRNFGINELTYLICPLLWWERSIIYTYQLHWTSNPCTRFIIECSIVLDQGWYGSIISWSVTFWPSELDKRQITEWMPIKFNQEGQTWSPTVKLKRSILFFPGMRVMGTSMETSALSLFPFLLPTTNHMTVYLSLSSISLNDQGTMEKATKIIRVLPKLLSIWQPYELYRHIKWSQKRAFLMKQGMKFGECQDTLRHLFRSGICRGIHQVDGKQLWNQE